MKKSYLFVAAILGMFVATAQKRFDSSAYTQFYATRWEKRSSLPTQPERSLTMDEKIAGLSKCWAEAKYNFANFDLVPRLNWDSVYQAFIPKAMAAPTTEAYYQVLQNFYQHLRDGHTAIAMPPSYYSDHNGALPIEIRWLEGKAVVTRNASSRKEDAAIHRGMEVVSLDGVPLADYIRRHISPYINFSTPQDSTERIYRYFLPKGKAGSTVEMVFRDVNGTLIKKTLRRIPAEQFRQAYPLVNFKLLSGNIAYLQINSFNDPKVVSLFDSLFASIAPTTALIIDVRNNGGGNGNNGFEVLGCLTAQPFYTGKTILRQYKPVGREWGDVEHTEIVGDDWKPYKNRLYSGPVVVLTSAATYSAAEDFTATFKSMKRGKVIGQPTGGSTGQPVSFPLPGGGAGYVCAKRDFFVDGQEFVGIGIQPDIEVHPTIKGVKAGKDEVLDAALQYLQTLK